MSKPTTKAKPMPASREASGLKNALADVGAATLKLRYEGLVKESTTRGDCILMAPRKANTSGYFPISVSKQGRVLSHHLAMWYGQGEDWTPNPKKDVSHLCKHKHCLNPNHYCEEDRETNLTRPYCFWVFRHKPNHPHVCGHEPQCQVN